MCHELDGRVGDGHAKCIFGRSPVPALMTRLANPDDVNCAFAGGLATSAGAGIEPPAAMARVPLPAAATPDVAMPTSKEVRRPVNNDVVAAVRS